MPSPEGAPGSARRHRRATARDLFQSLLSPSKFALVGISGIFVNQFALYAFTEYLGIWYVASSILASQVSTLTNFVLTELWVFRGRKTRGHVLVRYLVFNVLNAATLLVRIPVLYLLTELGGIHYLISNLVAIGLTFGIRYVVADNWIWAGRDRRAQRSTRGYYQYDIHGLVRVRSTVHLPELAAFNVDHEVEPDLIIRRAWVGGWPRLRTRTEAVDGVVRYREHLGLLGAAFDVTPAHDGRPARILANWLLVWSRHVLYTNMVEPVLRFMLVERGHVLLHCAAVDGERGAIVMSAQTDTGKTSTVLRLLMHGTYGFISDDMAIVAPDGEILSYAKPMTLSSHTMSAVNEQRLPLADRLMLAIRSRVHSKEGRSLGHALGRLNVPIVTINAWVQLLVPPPKYHVTSLVDCDLTDRAPIDSVVLMERGSTSLAEEPALEPTIDELLENTDDAYTFPPFATVAPLLSFGGLDYPALRARERELLTRAVSHAWRLRLRVVGHSWSEVIPALVGTHRIDPGGAGAAAPGRVGETGEGEADADAVRPVTAR